MLAPESSWPTARGRPGVRRDHDPPRGVRRGEVRGRELLASRVSSRHIHGGQPRGLVAAALRRRRANQATRSSRHSRRSRRAPGGGELLVTGGDRPLVAARQVAAVGAAGRSSRPVHLGVGTPTGRRCSQVPDQVLAVRSAVRDAVHPPSTPSRPVQHAGRTARHQRTRAALPEGRRLMTSEQTDYLDISELIRPAHRAEPGRFVLDVPAGVPRARVPGAGSRPGPSHPQRCRSADEPALDVRNVSAQLIGAILPGRKSLAVETLRRGRGTLDGRSPTGRRARRGAGPRGRRAGALPCRGPTSLTAPGWLGVSLPADWPRAGRRARHRRGAAVGPRVPRPDRAQAREGPAVLRGRQPEVVGWLSPRGPVARVDAALVAALATRGGCR